jgi:hypothetical protein
MRRREEPAGNGKSKMTVMMFQLEGADETLREGIRTISQAMGNVLSPPRMLLAKPPASDSDETVLTSNTEPAPFDTEEEQEADRSIPRVGASKPRPPKILQLDLNAGKVPLKEFCEQKAVGDNDSRRYLVIAFWLKENLNIPAVTMDHVHTCYRFLGWQTPADASSPLRSMKRSGWFEKGEEKGSYAINHVGENQVIGTN